MGDFLLTWPLLMGLGRAFAQCRIICVTSAHKGALAEAALGVEWRSIENGWHRLFSDLEPPAEVARLLTQACQVYSFAGEAAGASLRRLAPQATVDELRLRPDEPYEGHVTRHLLQQLQHRPAVHEAMRQMIQSINTRGLRNPGNSGPVLIHPGSGGLAKCWPLENFVALAQRLLHDGKAVSFVLGEAEQERLTPAQQTDLTSVAKVLAPPTALDLWRQLVAASAYVGNDAGPTHLAGLAGLPTLTLFGPSNPLTWKPLGPRVRTLHAQPLAAITVEQAYEALDDMMQRTGVP